MSATDDINKLILTGSLMAEQLRSIANELDHTSGANPDRPEHSLPRAWENYLERLRHEQRKTS